MCRGYKRQWMPVLLLTLGGLLAMGATSAPPAEPSPVEQASSSHVRTWNFTGELTAEAPVMNYRLNLNGDRRVVVHVDSLDATPNVQILNQAGQVLQRGRTVGSGQLVTSELPAGQYVVAVEHTGSGTTGYDLAVRSEVRTDPDEFASSDDNPEPNESLADADDEQQSGSDVEAELVADEWPADAEAEQRVDHSDDADMRMWTAQSMAASAERATGSRVITASTGSGGGSGGGASRAGFGSAGGGGGATSDSAASSQGKIIGSSVGGTLRGTRQPSGSTSFVTGVGGAEAEPAGRVSGMARFETPPDILVAGPRPDETAAAYRNRTIRLINALPENVQIVEFFSNVWAEPPRGGSVGSEPSVVDGRVQYVHRYPEATAAIREHAQATGRKAIIYVNPFRVTRLHRETHGEDGRDKAALMSIVLDLKEEGWDGVYFDGLAPYGEARQDEAGPWMKQLIDAWPDIVIVQHSSGLTEPGIAESYADVVLFGEHGERHENPYNEAKGPVWSRGEWSNINRTDHPLFVNYIVRLREMGVWPTYKMASIHDRGRRDDYPRSWPTEDDWEKMRIKVGIIRHHTHSNPRPYLDAKRLREQQSGMEHLFGAGSLQAPASAPGQTQAEVLSAYAERLPPASAGWGDAWTDAATHALEYGDEADGKAMARWNTVPYQRIDDTFEVGVVAFHQYRIDRVTFHLPDRQITVDQPTRNPRTGSVEYWIELAAADFADGPVELRAIVYPRKGVPRILAGLIHQPHQSGYPRNGEHSLFLVANANHAMPTDEVYVSWAQGNDHHADGTADKPFRTIAVAAQYLQAKQHGDAGGGVIYLMGGEHPWVGWSAAGREGAPPRLNANRAWLTITAAPGLSYADVAIVADNGDAPGLRGRLIRLHNLTVRGNITTDPLAQRHGNPTLWFDHCLLQGANRTADLRFAQPDQWRGGVYATHTALRDTRHAVTGWTFARDLHVSHIGADAFQNMHHIVGASASHIGDSSLTSPANVLHWNGSDFENVIVYGLKATTDINARPLFSHQSSGQTSAPDQVMSNIALANLLMHTQAHAAQWRQPGNHLLLWHVTVLGQDFLFRDDDQAPATRPFTTLNNFSIRASVFEALTLQASQMQPLSTYADGAIYPGLHDHNHVVRGPFFGTNATTGDPKWNPAFSDQYIPAEDSPLRERVYGQLLPYDVHDQELFAPAWIGAAQPDGRTEPTTYVLPAIGN